MIPRTAIPISNREIAVLVNRLLLMGDGHGEQIKKFEREFADYLDVNEVRVFNSGRTALSIALQALELKPGDEVLTPAYTCAIVFEVILRLGLKVVPVDVDPETYNINPDLVPKVITPKTKVVIPIHLFGQPCKMDEIIEIAERHGLYLIEDVAQALGATYKKKMAGTFGCMSVFSFGPGKSITSGEGGALAINNTAFGDKVEELQRQLKTPDLNWNWMLMRDILAMKVFSKRYLYGRIRGLLEGALLKADEDIVENCVKLVQQGKNALVKPTVKLAKMPAVSAEIARIQLKRIDKLNQKRRDNAAQLSNLLGDLKDSLSLPHAHMDAKHMFTRYTLRVLKGSRESLRKQLQKQGIDTEKPYFNIPKVLQAFEAKKCSKAISLSKSALTVPNHPLVRPQDIAKIANVLTSELASP